MSKYRVTIKGIELTVEGVYNKGSPATRLEPGEPAGFEIESIKVARDEKDDDITPLLSDDVMADIDDELINNYFSPDEGYDPRDER